MDTNELVLIDLSSIAYPIWHMSQSEPDPNKASQAIVARVRALASSHPHAAICCDAGRSFRKDLAPSYKAQRPEHEATLFHQIDLAKEQLSGDGFPIWAVAGFEADDLIATAVTRALGLQDLTVLIVSADKDLLQLIGPRVRAMSVRDGSILDAEAVKAKFGVLPAQMRDYLSLVGDASDNIKGADGIGPKKAADLLNRFGSLDHLYEEMKAIGPLQLGIPAGLRTALKAFEPTLALTRQLITLRTDVALPFEEIARERVAKEVETFGMDEDLDGAEPDGHVDVETDPAAAGSPATPAKPVYGMESVLLNGGQPAPKPISLTDPPTALAVREPADVLAPAPAEWERQLDPRGMKDAIVLAKHMFESRMFSAYGTPQGVLSTVMVGRELGLPAMASLRSIHVIEGRHALSAALMVALVLKSGLAEYFEPISFDEQQATFETHRKGARNPVRLQHTIAMAVTAGLTKPNSNWLKIPGDMLLARAQSRLARLVFPDLLAGLYTPDELIELRTEAA